MLSPSISIRMSPIWTPALLRRTTGFHFGHHHAGILRNSEMDLELRRQVQQLHAEIPPSERLRQEAVDTMAPRFDLLFFNVFIGTVCAHKRDSATRNAAIRKRLPSRQLLFASSLLCSPVGCSLNRL